MALHGQLGGDLRARPTSMDDLSGVLDLITLVDIEALGEADIDSDELRTDWQTPGFDLDRDSLVVEHPTDGIVGYLLAMAEPGAEVFIDTYTHPNHRADTHLESFLLDEGLARANAAARRERWPSWTAAVWTVEGDARLDDIATLGFEPTRQFLRMAIDLDAPPEVAMPAGIRLQNPASDDDHRLAHRLANEAFVDHWNHHADTWEAFRSRRIEREEYDPALWWIARDAADHNPLGIVIGRAMPTLGTGWVSMLGVLPPARGRGLGGALLRAAFASIHARGISHVELSVDANSTTGATRLYEREGMTHKFTLTRHELPY